MLMQSDPYFSRTLERGLALLSYFNHNRTRNSLKDAARHLGINKASAYRYMNTLATLGYVDRIDDLGQMRLGDSALILGYQLLQSHELLQSVQPIVDRYFQFYNITIDVVLYSDDGLIALYRREAAYSLGFRHPLVTRSLHARATGKSVLAKLPEADARGVIAGLEPLQRKTPHTIVDAETLMEELRLIRARGYATASREFDENLLAIAAPFVNDATDEVVGAVSFDFLARDAQLSDMEAGYADTVRTLARDLSTLVSVSGAKQPPRDHPPRAAAERSSRIATSQRGRSEQ